MLNPPAPRASAPEAQTNCILFEADPVDPLEFQGTDLISRHEGIACFCSLKSVCSVAKTGPRISVHLLDDSPASRDLARTSAMSLAFALLHAGVRVAGSSDDEGFALRAAELETVMGRGPRLAEVCAKAQMASLWLGCPCRQQSSQGASSGFCALLCCTVGGSRSTSVCPPD